MVEKILDPLLAPFRFLRDKVFTIKQAPARLQGEVSRAQAQVRQVKGDFQQYRADARNLKNAAGRVNAPAGQGGTNNPGGVSPPALKAKKMGFFSSLFSKKPQCPSCGNKMHPSWNDCPYCGWSKAASSQGAASAGGASPQGQGQGRGQGQGMMSAPLPAGGAQRTMALDMSIPLPSSASTNQLIGWFIPLEGKQMGELFQIKGRTVVGKAPDCQIVVDEASVSGHHAEFVPTSNGFRLYDLGSTNGTFVNDRRVQTHDLIDNDNVRLGRLNFKYKSIV